MPDDAQTRGFQPGAETPQATAAPTVVEAGAPRTPRPGRRLALIAAAAVVVVVAAAGLFNYWTVGRFIQSTNDAYLKADQVVIAPKVQGYVTRVLAVDNEDVRAGQPLVVIDTRSYQASLAQAEAGVEGRRADIAAAQAQLDQQRAAVVQAQARLAGARTGAAFAAREVERYAPLVASGADTAERLAQLASTRDQARQTELAEAAALTSAQRQIATLQAQIGQAKAQLAGARASADQVQLNLDDTVVTSPIAGRVGDKTVRAGQLVAPGARMMSVVPVSSLYVTANFKETQIGRMRPGQPVKIKVDALPGHEVKGVVDSFSPGTGAQFALLPPENATGNFTKIVQRVPVRIRLVADAEARKVLLPGLSATVKVDTRAEHPAS